MMSRRDSETMQAAPWAAAEDAELSLGDILRPLRQRWLLLLITPLVAGVLGLGASFLIPPTFSAKATFLTPQTQGGAAAALASLGNLASLAGAPSTRSPTDQLASLLASTTVADRLVDHFDLIKVYDKKFRMDARKELAENTRVAVGKRDGLISVEVEDRDPKRAAEMANQYIEELRTLTSRLALSEAQQRRAFFEGLMKKARDDLLKAQMALQSTGFNQGTLRAEPRAAAESYARIRAEVSAAEVKLEALRRALTDSASEVQRAQAELTALRAQLSRLERADASAAQPDYLLRYREFKYQETLFELFSRQFEIARVDEAREGAVIQVVDAAMPPERRARPKRSVVAGATALVVLVLLATALVAQDRLRKPSAPHSD